MSAEPPPPEEDLPFLPAQAALKQTEVAEAVRTGVPMELPEIQANAIATGRLLMAAVEAIVLQPEAVRQRQEAVIGQEAAEPGTAVGPGITEPETAGPATAAGPEIPVNFGQ